MSTLDKAVLGIAAVLVGVSLLDGGFIFGLLLGLLLLIAVYGLRFVADIEKSRWEGQRAPKYGRDRK